MKEIHKIATADTFTAINIGNLDSINEHTIIHAKSKQEVEGKVFLKEALQATGTEISFNHLAPKTELSYFHKHNRNEEIYIILKGSGDFQVNDECFPVNEGSVIRIAPSGIRGLRNSSLQPMLYIVIQVKENSLGAYSTDDGERVQYNAKWNG